MPFETQLPGITIANFTSTVVEVGGAAPVTIIGTDQNWRIDVHWETSGILSQFLPGTWHVEGYIETVGLGQEKEVGQVDVPLTPGPGTLMYDASINVPAGTVVPVGGEPSVPVRLVVAVTYRFANNHPGPMAGYLEGPIIQFYNPGP
jgi:hypothetical protein